MRDQVSGVCAFLPEDGVGGLGVVVAGVAVGVAVGDFDDDEAFAKEGEVWGGVGEGGGEAEEGRAREGVRVAEAS